MRMTLPSELTAPYDPRGNGDGPAIPTLRRHPQPRRLRTSDVGLGLDTAERETQPRALLIDLDGVIRRWDWLPPAPIEPRFGLPAGVVARAAFEPGLLEEAVLGRITDEEWRGRSVARLAEGYGHEKAPEA